MASCTASAATSSNNWTTTTCSTNNTSNVPVSSCTPVSPTAGNGYTTTSCSTNNTTNVAQRLVRRQHGQRRQQLDDDDLRHGRDRPDTDRLGLVHGGDRHRRQQLDDDDLPGDEHRPDAGRVVQRRRGGRRQQLDDDGLPDRTRPGRRPVASCTAVTASAGNSYHGDDLRQQHVGGDAGRFVHGRRGERGQQLDGDDLPDRDDRSDRRLVVLGRRRQLPATAGRRRPAIRVNTGPTPVASCTNAAAAAGNSWTATTCSSNNTSNVQVDSCAAAASTSSNGYTTTTCPAPTVVSGPTNVGELHAGGRDQRQRPSADDLHHDQRAARRSRPAPACRSRRMPATTT